MAVVVTGAVAGERGGVGGAREVGASSAAWRWMTISTVLLLIRDGNGARRFSRFLADVVAAVAAARQTWKACLPVDLVVMAVSVSALATAGTRRTLYRR